MSTLLRTIVRVATFGVLRRLSPRTLVVLGGVAVVVLTLVTGADAATYATSCPETGDPGCAALAERLEQLDLRVTEAANSGHGDTWALIGAVLAAGFVPPLLRELLAGGRS